MPESGTSQPQQHDELFEQVYDRLRRVAAVHFARERSDHTLQPTALVHEVYLRLLRPDASWACQRHFYAAAAEAMRRILIEHARRRGRLRRGGGRRRVDLDHVAAAAPADVQTPRILVLDEAIRRMEREDPRCAEVVKLRFFAGLSIEDTARAMQLSPMTVKRAWACAQAWLHGEVVDPRE
jgi:RNA polymerase sigma factor (TIGR02999 family)